jgi:hypothetical protein
LSYGDARGGERQGSQQSTPDHSVSGGDIPVIVIVVQFYFLFVT